ncbi:MAG: DUF2975 domain-containing protein [Lachnospiraceae bacterium]|nr:DUF2975 domain-containing protein [Lachnospiraceae bacterium]
MKQDSLAQWLKGIIIGIGICGFLICLVILPILAKDILYAGSGMEHYYWPWMVFIWISAIPCYVVLFYGWKVASNIGRDNSFCEDNAVYLKRISYMAVIDSIYFFVGNIVLTFMTISHPSVFIGSLFVIFAGISVAVAAAALSHLVMKAAALQEQSDLTI